MKKGEPWMYRFDLTRSGEPCQECGQTAAGGPCYPYSTHANLCHKYNSSQLRKMDALEEAWALMKAKKDAPNYRPCESSKCCGNCKAWDDSATEDPQTGHCEWYNFTCNKDYTCDAWAGK